jgi:hypothetical protein
LHRRGGPAVEYASGGGYWCRRGKLHRDDGPAIVSNDGTKQWWLNGNKYSEEDYTIKIKEIKDNRAIDKNC